MVDGNPKSKARTLGCLLTTRLRWWAGELEGMCSSYSMDSRILRGADALWTDVLLIPFPCAACCILRARSGVVAVAVPDAYTRCQV